MKRRCAIISCSQNINYINSRSQKPVTALVPDRNYESRNISEVYIILYHNSFPLRKKTSLIIASPYQTKKS
jgi:hypothetical protein